MMMKHTILMLLLFFFALPLTGCSTRTPYFLIESKLVEANRLRSEPDVTETPSYRALREGVRTLGIKPPDVCADRGSSAHDGTGRLQLGVMRTRCGVEMAELERALARAGYQVVSWSAIDQMSTRHAIPILEAAARLEIDALLQVNALERIEMKPGRDARFERRFFTATRSGERAEPARVPSSRAQDFKSLIDSQETSLATARRVGATINVSAVWVASGATIWFYEWTQVDDRVAEPRIEILVDCPDERCFEIRKSIATGSDDRVEGSVSGIPAAGNPADESQAIFHELVRSVVTDLAERFAGRRS